MARQDELFISDSSKCEKLTLEGVISGETFKKLLLEQSPGEDDSPQIEDPEVYAQSKGLSGIKRSSVIY